MRIYAIAALLLVGGTASDGALAHPHGWIDMQSKLVFDDEGRIAAIQQAWLFDELYSAFMLDEFRANGERPEDGLARLAAEDIAALAPFDYFTRFEVDGTAQGFGAVDTYANGVAGERIWLRFLLPLATPVAPSSTVRYAVYDSTYYIEVLHVGETPVLLEGPGSDACAAHLIQPQPSEEIIGFAASLDMFTVADDGLGDHFAQWVDLECASG